LADIVFAKDHLAKYCGQMGIEFYEFSDFRDVLRQLKWKLQLLRRHIKNLRTSPSDESMPWSAQRFIERARSNH
jgi:hypothetical protein